MGLEIRSAEKRKALIAANVSLGTSLVLLTMIACDSPAPKANNASLAVSTPTSTQVQDPLAATKQAIDQQQQQLEDQLRTADILSHVPTHIPGPPPTDTPGPSPTWEMGIFQSCMGSGGGFAFVDCWRGTANGEVISVVAGGLPIYTEGGKGDAPTGHTKAALMLGRGPYMPHAQIIVGSPDNAQFYYVPLDAELVGIASANGTQLTLSVDDQQHTPTSTTIIFDVANREFLNMNGTPIAATPIPTAQP